MSLMEMIADMRKKYNDDNLISVKDYKEIVYFLNREDLITMKRDITSYCNITCSYNMYVLNIKKFKDHTDLSIVNLEDRTNYSYTIK